MNEPDGNRSLTSSARSIGARSKRAFVAGRRTATMLAAGCLAVALAAGASAAPQEATSTDEPTAAAPVVAPGEPTHAYGAFVTQIDLGDAASGVALGPDGSIAVVDPAGGAVRFLNADGSERATLRDPRVRRPSAICLDLEVDPPAWLIVDARRGALVRIGLDGRLLGEIVPEDGATAALRDPVAVAVHGDRIAVVERRHDRVRILDRSGAPIASIGSRGRGEGELLEPNGCAFDDEGRLLVADTGNDRVQVFASDGSVLRAFGARGAFPGLLARPMDVAFRHGRIYVVEELNHRVSAYQPDGEFIYQWGMHAVVPREGEGRIHYPTAVAFTPDDALVAVCEPFERRIQIFSTLPGGVAEARRAALPSKQDVASHFGGEIAIGGDLLATWEPESGAVVVFDLRRPVPINITVFGESGVQVDDVGRVGALHVDADPQRVFVADALNDRLVQYDLERDREERLKYDPFMARLALAVTYDRMLDVLRQLDGDRPWRPLRIVGLARIGPDAPLLALDAGNGVLLQLDERLRPIGLLEPFIEPIALAAGDEGTIWILEAQPPALVRIDGLSDPLRLPVRPRDTGFVRPSGLAIVGGRLLIADEARDVVEVFNSRGLWIERIGARGSEDGLLWLPQGLAAWDGDHVAVLDRGNHRIQRFRVGDGTWTLTFSLSGGNTEPRRR